MRSTPSQRAVVERYWRRMLCGSSWAGHRLTWDAFNQIKERTPLLPPKLRLPYSELQALAVL
jgi:RNA-directed DNA polymerase